MQTLRKMAAKLMVGVLTASMLFSLMREKPS